MSHYHASLIAEIDQLLVDQGISETTFGRNALGDPHFVRQLRAGRDVRMSTVERVRKFINESRAGSNHEVKATPDSEETPTGQCDDMSGACAGEAA